MKKYYQITLLFTGIVILTSLFSAFRVVHSQARQDLAPIMVTNTNDSGAGSLRQAILDANATPGTDTVNFSIGSGVQTISPLTPLPEITDPVNINGVSQPGFSGTPLIVISGSSVTGSGDVYGLHVSAGGSTIRSLVIINFTDPAPQAIRLDTNGGNTVQGCYIGVTASGTTRARNYMGMVITSSGNLIGGTTLLARNVISGSSFENIAVAGSAASNNTIQGNFIGTNAAGTATLSDGSGQGIDISTPGTGNKIGGTEPGAGNLISGNGQNGVRAGAPGTIIQGNLIGTDVTGMAKIANTGSGVSLECSNCLLGGGTSVARNVISGNGGGVAGGNFSNTHSAIQGNFIGTDKTGKNILSNSSTGIDINGAITIGGANPGEGNVISGNLGSGGIIIRANAVTGEGSTIQGNFIGTDDTGTVALGNNNRSGVILWCSNNTVKNNVISGNFVGVSIGGGTTAPTDANTIQGNLIGTDLSGTIALGNMGSGIAINAGSNNVIGGQTAGTENKIYYNNGPGIALPSAFFPTVGNLIKGNSIFLNNGLGIDLSNPGVTANDPCDADTGPNNLQNLPVLTAVTSNTGTTTFTGTLNSTASSSFTLDFYANPTADASGSGEGRLYLGSSTVTTDGGCNAPINVSISSKNAGGLFVSATATDSTNNTSEFSSVIKAAGTSGKTDFDFEGDGRSNLAVYRPASGAWYVLQGANAAVTGFGLQNDKIVPADYDGDGKTDIAVYRDGTWYVLRSQLGFTAFNFGLAGDLPVPGDFNGDGRADYAVFRPSNGVWYVLHSNDNSFFAVQWGLNGDKPVIGDYDGDGKSDLTVYRPSDGNWYTFKSSNGSFSIINFGLAEDKPVSGDFDGDGISDIAVFRPSTGVWYLLQSQNGIAIFNFGIATDSPSPADYDGDGKADIAIFRNGNWYIVQSSNGAIQIQSFGIAGDQAAESSYVY